MQQKLLVYKSSAGSGKTTQIVIEYLNLVIPSPREYRKILAITFTNKAAEEMKRRIVDVLEMLSRKGCQGEGLDIFTKGLLQQNMTEDAIQANASEVLKNILHNYSGFAVSTIDSLMHRIIRSFAFDLNLSQRFEVLLDQEELIEKSVDLLLDELTPGSKLTHFLVNFVKTNTDESRSWHIDRSLVAFGKVLQTDEAIDYMPQLKDITLDEFISVEKTIKTFIATFEEVMNNYAGQAFKAIGDIPPQAFSHGKTGVFGFFNKIRNKKYRQGDGGQVFRASAHARKFLEEDSYFSSKATPADKSSIDAIAQQLKDTYKQIADYALKNAEKYFFYRMLLRNLHGMAVLKEIESRLDQLKAEKDCIHISEFNRRISREIQANATVPFIYERIGEQYYHCFVDEFQDTSVLQWHNLLPLLSNGLSYAKMNMLVGDAKQSIYRWRGGEVEQFSELPGLFGKQKLPEGELFEQTLRNHYQEKALNTNYRSAEAVVAFNNALFEYIKSNTNDRIRKIYDAHRQTAIRKHYGKVSVSFAEGRGEALAANHLTKVLEAVDETLSEGYSRDDIAILCRTKDKGMQVARFLAEKGHQVVSSDSLLLSGSPKLHFITALMRLLTNPSNALSRLEVVAFLYKHQENHRDSFHEHAHQFVNTGLNAGTTMASEAYRQFLQLLNLHHIHWENYSLYDLAEHLVRHFKLHQPADPFITFFLEEIYRKTQEQETGLTDFLEWWDGNKTKRSIVAPEKSDAIKVYTIHKSKGLEFPVVIAPFISSNAVKPTNSSLWVEMTGSFKEAAALPVAYIPAAKALHDTPYSAQFAIEEEKSLLDEINVLYVAFTRPSDRLYVISDTPPGKKSSTSMASLLAGYLESEGMQASAEKAAVFEKGTQQRMETIRRDAEQHKENPPMISASWRNKIVIAPQAPAMSSGNKTPEAQHWGSILHEALARVFVAGDVSKATEHLLYEGLIEEDQALQVTYMIEQVVRHPQLSPLFSDDQVIRTEHPLLLKDGTLLRPDRLIFNGDQVTILEYKTGEKQKEHQQQVLRYAEAIAATGYKVTAKYLVYLNDHVTVEELSL